MPANPSTEMSPRVGWAHQTPPVSPLSASPDPTRVQLAEKLVPQAAVSPSKRDITRVDINRSISLPSLLHSFFQVTKPNTTQVLHPLDKSTIFLIPYRTLLKGIPYIFVGTLLFAQVLTVLSFLLALV